MGVASKARTEVHTSSTRLRWVPMGTWPALEVTDIKTAITTQMASLCGQHTPGGLDLNNNIKNKQSIWPIISPFTSRRRNQAQNEPRCKNI